MRIWENNCGSECSLFRCYLHSLTLCLDLYMNLLANPIKLDAPADPPPWLLIYILKAVSAACSTTVFFDNPGCYCDLSMEVVS
jgi:hypothetical protein